MVKGIRIQQFSHQCQLTLAYLDGLIVTFQADIHLVRKKQPIFHRCVRIVTIQTGVLLRNGGMFHHCCFLIAQNLLVTS